MNTIGETVLIVLCLLISFTSLVLALSDQVFINVSVDGYHSYTKALDQRQDYLIECDGSNLLNITVLGEPIILENITEELCQ